MFTKKKPEAYEVNDLARDLDAAIAKAQAAFVHSDHIVDLLENHIVYCVSFLLCAAS